MPLIVGVLELIGYREWTESLGYDREWRIQVVQSTLYAELQKTAAAYGGFIAPMSYDVMVLVANGVGFKGVRELYEKASRMAPVPVSLTLTRFRADLSPKGRPGLFIEVDGTEYPVAAVHIDLNGFTGRRMRAGIVSAYTSILAVYGSALTSITDSIPVYLGGDNMVFFTGEEYVDKIAPFVEEMTRKGFKAGIGIGPNARIALEAAAEALHKLRAGEARDKIIVRKQ